MLATNIHVLHSVDACSGTGQANSDAQMVSFTSKDFDSDFSRGAFYVPTFSTDAPSAP